MKYLKSIKLLRKGSVEVVSVVLLVVILGGLVIAIAGSIAKQSQANSNTSLDKNTQYFQNVYNQIKSTQ